MSNCTHIRHANPDHSSLGKNLIEFCRDLAYIFDAKALLIALLISPIIAFAGLSDNAYANNLQPQELKVQTAEALNYPSQNEIKAFVETHPYDLFTHKTTDDYAIAPSVDTNPWIVGTSYPEGDTNCYNFFLCCRFAAGLSTNVPLDKDLTYASQLIAQYKWYKDEHNTNTKPEGMSDEQYRIARSTLSVTAFAGEINGANTMAAIINSANSYRPGWTGPVEWQRLRLLNQNLTKIGADGAYAEYSSIAYQKDNTIKPVNGIAWPSNNTPYELFYYEGTRSLHESINPTWSVNLTKEATGLSYEDGANIRVKVVRTNDGRVWNLQGANSADGELYIEDHRADGCETVVSFRLANIGPATVNDGDQFKITISNTNTGAAYSYNVNFFALGQEVYNQRDSRYDGSGSVIPIGMPNHPTDNNNQNTASTAAPTGTAAFTDLDKNAWYMRVGDNLGSFPGTDELYIEYAIDHGLMSGYDDGRFGPNDNVTRAQAATIIYRMATGKTAQTTDNNVSTAFTDVPRNAFYTAAVKWCADNNVVTGYGNGKFGPDDLVTREQLATMIARYCTDYKKLADNKVDISGFGDYARVSTWARDGLAYCNANKIITGYAGKNQIGPQDTATRCQMAKIIAVTAKLCG